MMNTSVSCKAEQVSLLGFDGIDRYIKRVSPICLYMMAVLAEAHSVSCVRMKVVTRIIRPSQSKNDCEGLSFYSEWSVAISNYFFGGALCRFLKNLRQEDLLPR